ncbi:hypothetical protein [Wolbachia endosymbiont of Drosophila subpulchrella]|nr:hypothetical protein [Wolbachia endosymbiont of Drosophila subpulchrella]
MFLNDIFSDPVFAAALALRGEAGMEDMMPQHSARLFGQEFPEN